MKKRLLQVHLSTLFAIFITASVLLLLNLVGGRFAFVDGFNSNQNRMYSYGWPAKAYYRTDNGYRWLWSNEGLVTDIVVAITVILLVAIISEYGIKYLRKLAAEVKS